MLKVIPFLCIWKQYLAFNEQLPVWEVIGKLVR